MDVEAISKRAEELLGVAFLDKGRLETDGALDCFGLVHELWRAGGVELPDPGRAERVDEALEQLGRFVMPVEQPEPGAIVTWRKAGERCDHVGVYLGRGRVAQAVRNLGVIAARMSLQGVRCYVPRVGEAD